jgi:LysR family transcriptional activator of nhaA
MKALGQSGTGVFIAPTPIAMEVEKQYGVVAIGQTNEVREQFFAISVERKISHPGVAAITETAREWLVSQAPRKHRKECSRVVSLIKIELAESMM